MAATPKPLGTVGGRVASNLRQLRKGTSTYELSRQLTEIGWPIRASAITLIESGRRRVDVDDLVALAVALGVSPNRLMFPSMLSRPGVHYALRLVGRVEAMDTDMWAWAVGERPLVKLEDGGRDEEPSGREVAEFRVQNQPHLFADAAEWTKRSDRDAVASLGDALAGVVKRGTPVEEVRKILNQAIEQAADGES